MSETCFTLPRLRGVIRTVRTWCGTIVATLGCMAATDIARAAPLSFKEAVATYEPADETGRIGETIDGILSADNGWDLRGGQHRPQGALFILDKPVTASIYQVQLSSLAAISGAHPACFSASVTTDSAPTMNSRWTPLIPKTAFLNDFSQVRQGGIEFQGGRIIIRPHPSPTVLTFRATAPVGNVTAFNLRLFPYTSDGAPGRPASLGCDAQGSLVLTEFHVEADPLRSTNIAIGRVATCSGPIVGYLPAWYLTDGFDSTFTHPENPEGRPFHFDFDLGRHMDLDHIVIRSRGDGRRPDRLSRYRMQVLQEGSKNPAWEASLRSDGSNPGVGGSDVVRNHDGKGTFGGRHLRILNQTGQADSPQIAEVEIYPALRPVLSDWFEDATPVSGGTELEVSARSRRIAFTVQTSAVPTVRDLITYRWKVVGQGDSWQMVDSSGKAVISPIPVEGHYRLVVQARHTDGRWDESEANVSLSIIPPWWRRPGRVLALLTAFIGLVGATCWAVSVRRIKTELGLARQRAALNQERLRISRDMHDDVGARLTGLALLADRCQKTGSPEALQRLATEARASVAALDEIVWSVNPRHDTIGSLVEHLEDHALSYLQTAGINCLLEVDVPWPEHSLGLQERHLLLMASKEALQNAVKHAHADTVTFTCQQTARLLTLQFADNGQGLSSGVVSGTKGDGVENMHQRLREAGGSCEIQTAASGGTAVTFLLPLPPQPPST
ncbi:histidine kinase [Verrucomicrobium sp. BvORR106]|uniref:histidine kinase n=1 Tax=Verrucomicrobium sp. BvORR106 TaxID=1403819 RepID=UPI0009E0605D|nr:histidine kinase [Verrucomicrobium sp. BvORR106]